MSPSDAFNKLSNTLAAQTHLYTCSGSVDINAPVADSAADLAVPDSGYIRSKPIVIRYDVNGSSSPDQSSSSPAAAKITLPLAADDQDGIAKLLAQTTPATFGLDGQHVYDEQYRKAVKMDEASFCSTFNPYELGIIDEVAQLLLPTVKGDGTHCERAVREELYKLNVYSSPSGKFKAHVDTPRSTWQFGSLVVCLPVAHEGGQLVVRHGSQETVYDWGANTHDGPEKARIQWAAFYSDCEHEVREVTSGHRITLTYNLYAAYGIGRLAGSCPTLDATSLPVYQAMAAAFDGTDFGAVGRRLGIFCRHSYAHTQKGAPGLPAALKGVDMVVWESLRALGLEPEIAPVMAKDHEFYELEKQWLMKQQSTQDPDRYAVGDSFSVIDHGALDGHDYSTCAEQIVMYADFGDRGWGFQSQPNTGGPITWLNKPGMNELHSIVAAYGNEPSVSCEYSYCAIVVTVRNKDENGSRSESASAGAAASRKAPFDLDKTPREIMKFEETLY